jgi:hypothetical protein
MIVSAGVHRTLALLVLAKSTPSCSHPNAVVFGHESPLRKAHDVLRATAGLLRGSISTSGSEHVLHSFGNDPDGAYPASSLIDVKGTLYGTADVVQLPLPRRR